MRNEPLYFNNGKFKILVITDLHEWTSDSEEDKPDIPKTEDAKLLIDASVKALNPDLVVFDGDNAFGDTEDVVRDSVETITKSIKKMNKKLAIVFGNHEHDTNMDRVPPQRVMEIFNEYENCYMFNEVEGLTGFTNFNITINDSDDNVKFNLWFIDSNGPSFDSTISDGYDWVHDDQIEWYEQKSAKLTEENGGKPVPAILFQHIPVPEEYKLMREAKANEMSIAVKGKGLNEGKSYVPKDIISGNFNEPIGCPDYNNGQFDSWKKMGDIRAAFFGHDHINDFEGYVDGILLAQCRGAGFHGYHEGDKTGVKLITIKEDDLSFETKDYYFTDFGLTSKTESIESMKNQKKTIKTSAAIGAGLAALTAAAVAVSKVKKKKKKEL